MQRGECRGSWRGACSRVTARESEILAWVAAGKSDWAIGRILNISGKTVNFHVENAKRKLGVGTRLQAVIAAMRAGIIAELALGLMGRDPEAVIFIGSAAILA
jgi:DNA-binding CsgD family transcriptional regulator